MLRLIHIEKNPESPTTNPTYAIIDAGRHGEEFGAVPALYAMTRQQVGDWLAREGLAYSEIERVLSELQQTGSAEVQLQPRVGPRIVRAWFDTVINPLVTSLESEQTLLDRRNWTFSFRSGRLDLIRPLREYLDSEAWANLEQILQAQTTLEANAAEHDAGVERLRGTVASLHELLAKNPEFKSRCESLLTPDKLQELDTRNPLEIFGLYSGSDRYELIAQYVVNNTGDLSSHYTTAKFWNRNREVLMQSLELPGIRECYASTIQLGDYLKSVTQTILTQMKILRQELSLRYDVPLVTGSRAEKQAS